MANHYAKNGDHIIIISISRPKSSGIFQLDDNVGVKYLNVDLETGNKIISKIKSVFALRSYCKKINHSTILLGIGTYPALLIATLQNKTLIKIGCQHSSYAAVKHIWAILRWILFRRLDLIISLTEHDLPNLRKLNKNVVVIPNSINFFPDQPAKLQNKTILSIGRMDHLKGYDLLIEMFSLFCKKNHNWNLHIIGDGPLRGSIINLIGIKGLTKRISVDSSSASIMEEYLNASVYLTTSRSEGLPMVLLEAQACGLPAIAFNCETGPSDIINNGKDGYLIQDFDIKLMSEKLLELCGDFNKRDQFGKNARENIKKFMPDRIFDKWDKLFSELTHSN